MATEISLHSHKKGLSPFPHKGEEGTVPHAVPGMFQSALYGVEAMVI